MMTISNVLLERARVALHDCPISAVRNLVVEQAGESLVISGRVSSFYHKQLAQEAIRAACRDISLVNEVAVTRPR
jgi:hypothetical protein